MYVRRGVREPDVLDVELLSQANAVPDDPAVNPSDVVERLRELFERCNDGWASPSEVLDELSVAELNDVLRDLEWALKACKKLAFNPLQG